jgi:penicillin-binding protein 1A
MAKVSKKKKHYMKPKKQPRRKLTIKKMITSLLSVMVFVSVFLFLVAAYLAKDLPDIQEMAVRDIKPHITIYDTNGTVLAKYGDFRGTPLTYSEIPVSMVQAVVAAEDRRFFDHFGIDIIGITRAYIVNLRAGRVVQGGSTITQQLAKIIYLSPERTFKRKIQEVLIALQLERNFSKEQILTMYLNRVYMGKGNYGIDAAAKYYFGKDGSGLNIFESAMLAGMLKAPSKYSPSNNLTLAVGRARQVLIQMNDEGYISDEQAKYVSPPEIIERGVGRGAMKNPYFADYVLSEVADLVENAQGDMNIYTTIDLDAQEALESAVSKNLSAATAAHGVQQAAALLMEKNGAIKAMVGGKSYSTSQYNRAVSAKRQAGSAFKFFVYTAAMEAGIEPTDTFVDEPVTISQGRGVPDWSPRNFDRKYRGAMSVEAAFAKSINTVAVKISESIGRTKVVDIGHRLGLSERVPNLPSIALGAVEVSLLDMVQAYAHIASDGLKVRAFGITKITDGNGNIMYEYPGVESEQIISIEVVEKMRHLMRAVVNDGGGRRANLGYMDSYGKTGTTQDHHDSWFIGSTGDMTLGVWMGNDDSSATKGLVGGLMPASAFHDFFVSVGEIDRTELTNDSTPWQKTNVFDAIFGDQ